MNTNENIYLDSLKDILENGISRKTKNLTILSKLSLKMDFDISESFPLITTKEIFWKGVVHELIWFIKGDTNSKNLEMENVNIWKETSNKEFLENIKLFEYEEGDCGPIYGFQWRHFGTPYRGFDYNYNGLGIDQLQNCINLIIKNPSSRRIFMSCWNPVQINDMCIAPSQISYQFYVSDKKELSCVAYFMSGDMFLSIPFNIASAVLLVYIIAKITYTTPKSISFIIGDAYIYEENSKAITEQLSRKPYPSPTLKIIKRFSNINDYKYDNLILQDYNYHPNIKT
jgi:thymidylate synthase